MIWYFVVHHGVVQCGWVIHHTSESPFENGEGRCLGSESACLILSNNKKSLLFHHLMAQVGHQPATPVRGKGGEGPWAPSLAVCFQSVVRGGGGEGDPPPLLISAQMDPW